MVGDHRPRVVGMPFWKLTGSGNDFVFVDGRGHDTHALEAPESVRRICARGTGVGADGLVVVDRAEPGQAFAIRYYNSDGSRGELCGNASLCSTTLGVRLGLGPPSGFSFGTDAGVVAARQQDGWPEIDLQPSQDLRVDAGIATEPGEQRIGFVNTGVPHLVVLVGSVEAVDLPRRGRELRHHPSLVAGANVNFVAAAGPEWRMRTYERGVEGETLACGTGSAASAILLSSWGLASQPVTIRTSSGMPVRVGLSGSPGALRPALRGEGRLVFHGELAG
ncbi:MAG: diaminopimelate epimerase [Gemmatimonadetes bacterium]|nr:diaminopimelate epimerase [Gemmatimonadota bacterium]